MASDDGGSGYSFRSLCEFVLKTYNHHESSRAFATSSDSNSLFPPGLVKILKKHDKRTGAVLRLPFIRRVLLQPFFATELLSKLVQDCENLLSMFPPPPLVESIDVQPVEGEEDALRESQGLVYPTGYYYTCPPVLAFILFFKLSRFYPS